MYGWAPRFSATAKAEDGCRDVTALPSSTLRLFDGYPPEELTRPENRAFLLERLLEEGDREDLRWLARQVDEAELRDFFRRAAARRLSARSRAFWRLVLGGTTTEEAPFEGLSRSEIWPLA